MATKRDVVQISSYSRRLKDNVKSMLDNYGEILKAAKVSSSEGQSSEYEANVYRVENEIEIRAANIVRAAESLSRLVSELKEYLILHDFSAINDSLTKRATELEQHQKTLLQDSERLFLSAKERELKAIEGGHNV
ncbi:PREDICTED: mediator of RNA polymerase II transcription subunit 22-like [Amphimedon queenslandica]|uniref:Mediator of RNA polymerase II transcription subunit 22 n=1 Tax=Amphimedon queenslandica TaxID=400682 RepID=A0A1X7UQE1_AMPQE|nr:PREDICTED: mediator of RNA polymerase II transcription subunit 22-like [Amphimedon queenslandica]|eukprot:XP_003387061.1 PREDICTED: mediator of RNA polymerase II transcription subunit 22-like [Amphimedon queenslandica]